MLSSTEVFDRIEGGGPAWVRVAAVRTPGEPWKAKLLEVTTGEPPPRWERESWTYPRALFDSSNPPGKRLAEMLRSGVIEVCGNDVTIAIGQQAVTHERKQSGAETYFQSLDWPADEAKLSISVGEQVPDPTGHMISDADAPSFVTFYMAAACFFRFAGQQASGMVTQDAVHRHQDRRARFNSVRAILADDTLELEVEGEQLDGLTLELAGGLPGPTVILSVLHSPMERQARSITLELNGGLGPGAWVLLRRGSEWIDRRFLSLSFGRQGEAGVEIVVDQASRLEALIGGWERTGVEFKRQVPGDKESKLKVMKSVCAFANGEGGSLLIGVDDDDRSYIGVDPPGLDDLKRRLDQMVRSWVVPNPLTHFEVLPIPDSDHVILELVVEPGTTLYGCGRSGETRRPYVRHHSSTEVASTAEMLAIAERGSQVVGWPVF